MIKLYKKGFIFEACVAAGILLLYKLSNFNLLFACICAVTCIPIVLRILDLLIFNSIIYVDTFQGKLHFYAGGVGASSSYIIEYVDIKGKRKRISLNHASDKKLVENIDIGKKKTRIYYTKFKRIILCYEQNNEFKSFYKNWP